MDKSNENPSTKFSHEEVENLREAFNMFVKDKTGEVAAHKIGALLKMIGECYTGEELHAIVIQASEDKNLINFTQFLRVMEDRRPAHDLEREIEEAFRQFDTEGNGHISKKELKLVMGKIGQRLTDDELDEMMKEADLTGDGQITFKEFRLLIMRNN